MAMLKCPVCNTPLKEFEDSAYELSSVGCPRCEWTTFKVYPEEAWKAAEEFINKFPPAMRVHPGDKIIYFDNLYHRVGGTVMGKDPVTMRIILEDGSTTADMVYKWPWQLN